MKFVMKNYEQDCKYGMAHQIQLISLSEKKVREHKLLKSRLGSSLKLEAEFWDRKQKIKMPTWKCYGSSLVVVVSIEWDRQEPAFGQFLFCLCGRPETFHSQVDRFIRQKRLII